MGITRHELQAYADVATLKAETLVPQANDQVMVESLKRTYNWIEASTLTEDSKYIIKQTSVATGRWEVSTASSLYTGTSGVVAIVLENGQQATETITVTGALATGTFNVVSASVTASGTEFLITSKQVIANDTVEVTIYNNSGAQLTVTQIDVTVLEF